MFVVTACIGCSFPKEPLSISEGGLLVVKALYQLVISMSWRIRSASTGRGTCPVSRSTSF